MAFRLYLVVTPGEQAWRRCGRVLSRYRERYGVIEPRDHQHDVLIVLAARQLASEQAVTLITENDAALIIWQIVMSLRDAPTDENRQYTQQSPMAAAAAPADEKGHLSYQSPVPAAARRDQPR